MRCVKSVVDERVIARRKNRDGDDDDESVGKRDKYTIIIISCSIHKSWGNYLVPLFLPAVHMRTFIFKLPSIT